VNLGLQNLNWERATGLLLVLGLHGAVLYGLWNANLTSKSEEATTVFVDFIDPPPLRVDAPRKRASPAPVKLDKPRPPEPPSPTSSQQLVAQTLKESHTEVVAAPLPALPGTVEPAPPAPAPKLVEPVNLTSELSVSCPVRTAPVYPTLARRMGEEGEVVLRVELNEDGQIASARVATSSGFRRLDEAALAAIKNWRCNAAQREGQPVRAVAIQPFKFALEGR
jgi:protein TonB